MALRNQQKAAGSQKPTHSLQSSGTIGGSVQGVSEEDDVKMMPPCPLLLKIPLRGIGGHDADCGVMSVTHPDLSQRFIIRKDENMLKMIFRKLAFQQFRQRSGKGGHFKDAQPPVRGPVLRQMPHNGVQGRIYAQAGRIQMAVFPGD